MTATALESRPPLPTKHVAAKRVAFVRPTPSTSASSWAAEVAVLPARSLLELPLPPVLTLCVPGIDGIVRITRDPEHDPDHGGDIAFDGIAFDSEEWRALVISTEADRLWPSDLVGFCRHKEAEPSFHVELLDALAGGQPDPSERWQVSRVLTRWGAELLSIDVVS